MQPARLRESLAGYAVAVVLTCAMTALVAAINHADHIPNVSLLYLPVILVTAVYFGTGPSLVAATLAVLEYDFFLLKPVFTFSIAQAQDALAFVIFCIVAVLTSQLAASARERADAAQRRAAESETLYELGQALMTARDMTDVLNTTTRRIVELFGVDRCAVFTPDADGRLVLVGETLAETGSRDRESQAAALYAFQKGEQVGLPSDLGGQRLYVPLRAADHLIGVMEVGARRSGEPLDRNARRLVASFAAQAALAMVRAQGDEERKRLEVLEESDRLKSALLSAVSHDLRTPLTSIKASATALLMADAAWTAEEGREFLHTINEEADKLNRLVGNLLDLSRIESGVLRPVLDWYDMDEVVRTVTPRLRTLLGGRPLHVDLQPGLPPVRLDLSRIEALVMNLVENAVKYTPPDTQVELRAWHDGAGAHLAVIDHGPGIPARLRGRVFDAFFRTQEHGDRSPGTGLGLTICRGVAEAHHGTIHIEDTPGGGATLVLTIPAPPAGEGVAV